jgi:hypothetical protein
MFPEMEEALEELANRFEMSGHVIWTNAQVADALRRFINDPDAPLTNRDNPVEK